MRAEIKASKNKNEEISHKVGGKKEKIENDRFIPVDTLSQ